MLHTLSTHDQTNLRFIADNACWLVLKLKVPVHYMQSPNTTFNKQNLECHVFQEMSYSIVLLCFKSAACINPKAHLNNATTILTITIILIILINHNYDYYCTPVTSPSVLKVVCSNTTNQKLASSTLWEQGNTLLLITLWLPEWNLGWYRVF